MKKEYALIARAVNVASATLQTGNKEAGIFKDLVHFSAPMYFWLFQEKADRLAKHMISNATSESVLQV